MKLITDHPVRSINKYSIPLPSWTVDSGREVIYIYIPSIPHYWLRMLQYINIGSKMSNTILIIKYCRYDTYDVILIII